MSNEKHTITETCACGAKLQLTTDNYGTLGAAQKRFHEVHKQHGDKLTMAQTVPPIFVDARGKMS